VAAHQFVEPGGVNVLARIQGGDYFEQGLFHVVNDTRFAPGGQRGAPLSREDERNYRAALMAASSSS
jgi:hypothetical protein